MRASFKMDLKVGKHSIPVKLYKCVDEDKAPLRLVCPEHHDHAPKQVYACPHPVHKETTGEFTVGELAHAAEYGDKLIYLSDEELNCLVPPCENFMEVIEVRDQASFPWKMVKSAYDVRPDQNAVEFEHFIQALIDNQQAAICKAKMGKNDHLVAIVPNGKNRYQMLTMYWEYEMRELPLDHAVINSVIDRNTVKYFEGLFSTLYKDKNAKVAPGVTNEYNKALRALVASKVMENMQREAKKITVKKTSERKLAAKAGTL